MSDTPDKPPDDQWLRDLPLRSEEIGFAADELVSCPKCEKRNAPSRPTCLYCGMKLGNESESVSLDFRELEGWENGYNLVPLRAAEGPMESARALAALTGADRDQLSHIFSSTSYIPVARVASAEAAAAITQRLAEHGVDLVTVRDEDLLGRNLPRRLRSVEFSDDHCTLTPFSAGEALSLQSAELALIVVGVSLTERTEATERKKRSGTARVAESRVSSDQPFLDIYLRADPTGWRIPVSGFDFSFLGADKALLAAQNIQKLLERLCSFAPEARVVDDYTEVRGMLEYCWPTDHRKDGQTPKLVGFGRREQKNTFTKDNLTQVTKYSRLQWYLL